MSVDDDLQRWRDAGLIDSATASSIRKFEDERAKQHQDRPGVAEALLYVGLAAVGVGAIVLGALLWGELTTAARILVLAVPGVLLAILGGVLRNTREPAAARGGAMAWVLAVALLTGAVAVILNAADRPEEEVAFVAFSVAVVLALAAWVVAPTHAQVVALAISLAMWCLVAPFQADAVDIVSSDGPLVSSILLVALGCIWIAVTEAGWMRPRVTARMLGGLGLAVGAYAGGFDSGARVAFETLVILAGAGLVALGVWRGAFAYVAFGVIALFLGGITIILRRVPDPAVGAMAVMVAGVLLVLAVLLLARWRPWEREPAA